MIEAGLEKGFIMSRTLIRSLFIFIPLAFLCGGCLAVGQSFALSAVTLSLLASGAGTIAIAALDKREWIKTGAKKPSFAGTLRGGFGNPFDVNVKGYVPLSDVFTDVVSRGLQAKGFKTTPVTLDVNTDDDAAMSKLTATVADKRLLINIHKWQADTMTNVGMHYLITAMVMDADGNVVAQNSTTGAEDGKDNLKGSVMNPAGYAKKAVPKAFAAQLEELLNNEDIVRTLS